MRISEPIKHYLSYLWPFSSRYESDYYGTLEVNYMNGRMMLDSDYANHSFGLTEELYEFALTKVPVYSYDKVLMLGLGACSFLDLIERKHGFNGTMTAVEIDKAVIDIGRDHFRLHKRPNLKIIHADAIEFIHEHYVKYDLILVDILIDHLVPLECYMLPFWMGVSRLAVPGGRVIFNAGVDPFKDVRIESFRVRLKPFITFDYHYRAAGYHSLLTGWAGVPGKSRYYY
jgi:spermidine synthase